MLNSKVLENVQKKNKVLLDAIFVLISLNQSVEQTVETIKTHVCAHAEETVKNIAKESAHKKRAAPDVQEFWSLCVARKVSLMTICAIWSALKIDF